MVAETYFEKDLGSKPEKALSGMRKTTEVQTALTRHKADAALYSTPSYKIPQAESASTLQRLPNKVNLHKNNSFRYHPNVRGNTGSDPLIVQTNRRALRTALARW